MCRSAWAWRAVVSCLIPEYAVGIRAWRTHMSDAFAQPRCFKDAIHGAKIGEWEYRVIDGRLVKITHWERVTP